MLYAFIFLKLRLDTSSDINDHLALTNREWGRVFLGLSSEKDLHIRSLTAKKKIILLLNELVFAQLKAYYGF